MTIPHVNTLWIGVFALFVLLYSCYQPYPLFDCHTVFDHFLIRTPNSTPTVQLDKEPPLVALPFKRVFLPTSFLSGQPRLRLNPLCLVKCLSLRLARPQHPASTIRQTGLSLALPLSNAIGERRMGRSLVNWIGVQAQKCKFYKMWWP